MIRIAISRALVFTVFLIQIFDDDIAKSTERDALVEVGVLAVFTTAGRLWNPVRRKAEPRPRQNHNDTIRWKRLLGGTQHQWRPSS